MSRDRWFVVSIFSDLAKVVDAGMFQIRTGKPEIQEKRWRTPDLAQTEEDVLAVGRGRAVDQEQVRVGDIESAVAIERAARL